jgi:hypothetical protein
MSLTRRIVTAVVTASSLVACVPSHLAKYRKDQPQKQGGAETASTSRDDGLSPSPADAFAPMPSPSREKSSTGRQARDDAPPRASIYAVDKQTFRFSLRENDVWDSVLNVLLRNYNLTIVDKASGIVTTEWDTYYLSNAVYRNKVSVRVFKSSWNSVDVTVHNNVERLRDASQAAGTVGAVWLPSDDPANEVARVVQNMALVLNQPPPVLPPNMAVAKDVSKEQPASSSR